MRLGREIECRINAGAMDFTEVPCSPNAMWEDFDMLYYDPEVGLENPVDEKVNKVGNGCEEKREELNELN